MADNVVKIMKEAKNCELKYVKCYSYSISFGILKHVNIYMFMIDVMFAQYILKEVTKVLKVLKVLKGFFRADPRLSKLMAFHRRSS